VLTNLNRNTQWFNTLISPSHESPVVYFVYRVRKHRPSLLQVQGCQWKQVVGSWQNAPVVYISRGVNTTLYQFRDGSKSHLRADAYFWSSENIRYKSV